MDISAFTLLKRRCPLTFSVKIWLRPLLPVFQVVSVAKNFLTYETA